MSEPAREAESRRDRLAFVLTLGAVVVAAALVGYVLGQVVFTRWVSVPGASRTASRPEQAEIVPPAPPLPAAPGPAPASGRVSSPAAPASAGSAEAGGSGPSAPGGPQVGGPGEARSWFVQVGAFGNADNAERTARAAQSEGYAARVVPSTGAQGATVYKVWIGPYASREQAVAEREKLKARWPDAFIP